MIRFDKQIKQKWKSRKIPKDFNKIPGSKILGNPVPKNPGIPGFGKILSLKIPGLNFLISLGPAHNVSVIQFSFSFIFLYIKAIALIFLLQASHDVSFIPFESSGNSLCGGTFQFQPLFWIQVRIEEDGVN